MYNNPYMPTAYSPQQNLDRVNAQINELERIRNQLQQPVQPTNLTQNFQISPTNRDVIRYANSLEEVQRDMVIGDTPYFSKDLSVVWIKNTKGEIKTYELSEIIPKDEKDLQIELLQSQVNKLTKEVNRYEQYTSNANEPEVSTNTTEYDESVGTTTKESKPTGVPRVSKSKTK